WSVVATHASFPTRRSSELGARVLRADVYARVPVAPSPRAVEALRRLRGPAWLALSSGEALATVLAALPGDARAALLRADVTAARSEEHTSELQSRENLVCR